jgi:hypothetical protein
VIPFTQARATLSDLAEQVKAMRSGSGNTMVEFLSAAITVSVSR